MEFIWALLFGIGVVINLILYSKLNAMAHEVIVQADRMNESCTDMVQANQEIQRNLREANQYFNAPPEV